MSKYKIAKYKGIGVTEHISIFEQTKGDIETYKDAIEAFVLTEIEGKRGHPYSIGCLQITGLQEVRLQDYKDLLYMNRHGETVAKFLEYFVYDGTKTEKMAVYVLGLGYSFLKCSTVDPKVDVISIEYNNKHRWYVLYRIKDKSYQRGVTQWGTIKAKDIIKRIWLNS